MCIDIPALARKRVRMRTYIPLLSILLIVSGVHGETQTDRIINPFYDQPAWHLWTGDLSPVTYAAPASSGRGEQKSPPMREEVYSPTPFVDRKYPDFSGWTEQSRLPGLKTFDTPPEVAGSWDDCYMTMDFAHSGMPASWGVDGESLSLKGQFININYGMPTNALQLHALGVNFTSQSFAQRGRPLVDDFETVDETERHFFFANSVRATPSHVWYEDKDPEKVKDTYDGLFGHSFHSLGQSGSETRALFKMMTAGACMPRETKDLLKKHGAYASALLTLFKAALPYVDIEGKDVPYEHELRHRPVYSSEGKLGHPHFCPANPYYHAYDDARHIRGMVELARGMTVAPPVALLKLIDITVQKDGETLVDGAAYDSRIKSANRTVLRIWGNPGETITVRMDARESYDLQGLDLEYSWHRIYPGQKNVTVSEDTTPGVWKLTARHDPKLPKGRIPVMLVTRNGSKVPSNPAFVNFYWPEEDEREDYWHYRGPEGEKESGVVREVTQNRRPLLRLGVDGDALWCRPGDTAAFSVEAEDPDGSRCELYRWPGEIGELRGGRWEWPCPTDAVAGIHYVHLVASDRTGGYTGARVRVIVAEKLPLLEDGWRATVLGKPGVAGRAESSDGKVRLWAVGRELHGGTSEGLFVYRPFSSDVDLICKPMAMTNQVGSLTPAELGLLVRESHTDFAKYALVSVTSGKAGDEPSCRLGLRPGHSTWGRVTREPDSGLGTAPSLLRLTRRGERLAGYVSAGDSVWEQMGAENEKLGGEILAGVAMAGGRPDVVTEGHVEWIEPNGIALPMFSFESKQKREKDGSYNSPVSVVIDAGGNDAEVRYTLDGSEVTKESSIYSEPITLEPPGKHVLRACARVGANSSDSVVAVVTIKGPVTE